MTDKEQKSVLNKLEEINYDYQYNNNLFYYGKHIKFLISLFKQRKFKKLFLQYKVHLKNKKNAKKTNKGKENNNKESFIDFGEPIRIHNDSDKKIAIYSCITGNYDDVLDPLVIEDNCDYILFTNNDRIKSDVWKIRKIPDAILELKDNAKINRYVKLHPKKLLKEYDYSIYIDGNIKIISNISTFIDKINDKTGLAIHRHTHNTCIFQEVNDCIAYGKGNKKNLKEQVNKYKKEGFPKEYGILQCNVLVSDLNNANSEKIFNAWWDEYFTSQSGRDQIALPYVLWKNHIKIDDIGNLGDDISKNRKIKVKEHI